LEQVALYAVAVLSCASYHCENLLRSHADIVREDEADHPDAVDVALEVDPSALAGELQLERNMEQLDTFDAQAEVHLSLLVRTELIDHEFCRVSRARRQLRACAVHNPHGQAIELEARGVYQLEVDAYKAFVDVYSVRSVDLYNVRKSCQKNRRTVHQRGVVKCRRLLKELVDRSEALHRAKAFEDVMLKEERVLAESLKEHIEGEAENLNGLFPKELVIPVLVN